jgi:hypothetical protein
MPPKNEEYMSRFQFGSWRLAVAIFLFLSLFLSLAACGGHKAGPPIYPARVNLAPGTNSSLTLGGVIVFAATVQTANNTTINTAVTYSSSNTSVLNLAPNGVACAGHWDVAFTTCSPGEVGVVQVTASALGVTSEPTFVFVHPAIDSVSVTGILTNGLPVQEPCLSQGQSMTIEAHAFSQGTDITASVGPFNWSANNNSVVAITPILNTYIDNVVFATNEATAKAVTPGFTYIYASASGVTSTSFQQPQYTNSLNQTSPALDFFATCPIENIALEIGSAESGQTTVVAAKGTATASTVIATLTDIMENSSLPNTDGAPVLSKVPLTWTASQPGAVGTSAACAQSCSLSFASPGAGTVTASCSPPTCNVGFPEIPASFLTNGTLDPTKIDTCTQFFQTIYPQLASCLQVIPVPVYSSPVFIVPPQTATPLTPQAAISGLVTGSPSSTNVLATSMACAQEPPGTCSSSVYYPSSSGSSSGSENPTPVNANSFMFDLGGDKVYMGSQFGAEIMNPAAFGSSNSPYTPLGTVTGNVIGVSSNGTMAAFSDTINTPNQVYIVSAANTGSIISTPLNISSATTAGFSPDGLEAFILSGSSLYIYSPLQALQGPSTATPQFSLSGTANEIAFSPNGAFAYIAENSSTSASANLTAFAVCNNQIAATLSLPANPIAMTVLPNVQMAGTDSYGNPIPDGVHILILDTTGIDVITSTISPAASGTLCPQGLTFKPLQRVELGQTIQPPPAYSAFFASADASHLYVLTSSSSSIFVYNFISGSSTGGIELLNNAIPLSSTISVDTGTIFVAGSDGELHEVNTVTGVDLRTLTFPNLPNYYNPFCTFTPTAGPCSLSQVLAKP